MKANGFLFFSVVDLVLVPLTNILDAEQTVRPDFLINIKAWIQLGPLIAHEGGTQVVGSPKSLLV